MESFNRFLKTIETRTGHIPSEIERIAAAEHVHRQSIDFELLECITDIMLPEETEFKALDESLRQTLLNENLALDPGLQICQHYRVRFCPSRCANGFKFALKIRADSAKSYAEALILPDSFIAPALSDKRSALLEHFNRIKLRNGLLIDLYDEPMKTGIAELIRLCEKQPQGRLAEPFKLVLAQWPKPTAARDDELIWHYKKGPEYQPGDRVDHARRNYAAGVKEGDLLVEYRAALAGKAGRTFCGEFVPAAVGAINHYPAFSIDEESVELRLSDETWRYYARENGYVSFENNALKVEQVLFVPRISLKDTGHIETGLEEEVSIHVKSENISDEAVGSGMRLKAKRIIVEGSVGSNVLLEAKFIRVLGMVHQSAKLAADEIEVNILRGEAKGRFVRVENLEGGRIDGCKEAEVKKILGGSVAAENLRAGALCGQATLKAANLEIESITGQGNRLMIDSAASQEACDVVRKQAELAAGEEALNLDCEARSRLLEKHRPAVERHLSEIRSGRTTPNTLSPQAQAVLKTYRDGCRLLKEAKEQIDALKQAMSEQELFLEALDAQTLEATITIKSGRISGDHRIAWHFFNRPDHESVLDESHNGTRLVRYDPFLQKTVFDSKTVAR